MTVSINSSTLEATMRWDYRSTEDSGRIIKDINNLIFNGSIPSTADIVWHDQREVTTATATDDIDLQSLTDALGNSISFDKVYGWMVWNRGDKSGSTYTTHTGEGLQVGDAATNPWAAPFDGDTDGKLHIGTGGLLYLVDPVDGWAVSAGSKVLRVAHDGSTYDITYDIVVIGE